MMHKRADIEKELAGMRARFAVSEGDEKAQLREEIASLQASLEAQPDQEMILLLDDDDE
jgi:hypothetical protein